MFAKIKVISKEDVVESVVKKTKAKRALVNAIVVHQMKKTNDIIRKHSSETIDFVNMGKITIAKKLKGKTLKEILNKEND